MSFITLTRASINFRSRCTQSQIFSHGNNPHCRKMSFSNESATDYSRFLNAVTAKRKPVLIREMTKKLATAEPGTIFMAGGLPNPTLFPFESITCQVVGSSQPLHVSGDELRQALQYQPTMAYPALEKTLQAFIQTHFPPPPQTWPNTSVIVTSGSQNALSAVIEMCVSPGDFVVVPAPCYSSALNMTDPLSSKYLVVPEDQHGMRPDILLSVLEEWHSKNFSKEHRPKVLYVNPTGSNPSGVVIPSERKRQIYAIAQRFDLLILEDDPYYFLHFQETDPLTFLSLDVDGRVMRFDSFSKVLSSGIRIGFCTGPAPLVRTLELYLQATILHAASLSQVLVDGVLQKWGADGFKDHIDQVKAFYKKRRDMMLAAAEKHLIGLAEWTVPEGGMFLWLKALHVPDTYEMIMEKGLENRIMALPGREFMTDKTQPCPYIRLSFSVVPEDHIEEGIIRLAKLLREAQQEGNMGSK